MAVPVVLVIVVLIALLVVGIVVEAIVNIFQYVLFLENYYQ